MSLPATAGPGGAITPATQTVDAGATARFTVRTPDRGYAIAAVTGCNGSLSGAIYTTAPITAACTVSASFDAITVIVTLDGSLTAQVGIPYRGLLQATGGDIALWMGGVVRVAAARHDVDD
jgi:hypothetical protein